MSSNSTDPFRKLYGMAFDYTEREIVVFSLNGRLACVCVLNYSVDVRFEMGIVASIAMEYSI